MAKFDPGPFEGEIRNFWKPTPSRGRNARERLTPFFASTHTRGRNARERLTPFLLLPYAQCGATLYKQCSVKKCESDSSEHTALSPWSRPLLRFPNLWLGTGTVFNVRFFALPLALQLKARHDTRPPPTPF